jgi:hypothetical protein
MLVVRQRLADELQGLAAQVCVPHAVLYLPGTPIQMFTQVSMVMSGMGKTDT